MGELKPTPVEDWLVGDEVVELPSGRFARLRRVTLLSLLREGSIPQLLLPLVLDTLGMADDDPLEDVLEGASGDAAGEAAARLVSAAEKAAFVAYVGSQAFLEPRVFYPQDSDMREPAPAGMLHVRAVTDSDLTFAMQFALDRASREVDAVRTFRDEPAGDDASRDGGSVRPAAVGDHRAD